MDEALNQAQPFPPFKKPTIRGGGGSQKLHHNHHQNPSATTSSHTKHKDQRMPRNRGKVRYVIKPEVGSSSSSSRPKEGPTLTEQIGCLSIEEQALANKQEEEEAEEKKVDVGSDENSGDDVLRRLEELLEVDDELELSDEQLRINDQAQEDELLAMESIFGENVFMLERQRGLRSFQIHIHIEAPGGIAISTKLGSSTDLNNESSSGSSGDFSYSFTVQHLPPITLTCSLPESYPSHQPPYFVLSVRWLYSAKISNLCSMLDSLWMDQQGQEVIYQWVDWLQSSSLSHLGFDKQIELGTYGIKYVGDRRALTGSVSPDADVSFLRSYNNERIHENFLNDFHECCICFSAYPGAEFIRLPCKHFFCLTCMKNFSNMHVKEGTVTQLLCPDPKCKGMIPPGVLKRLLDVEEFERWESSMLEKTLESMSDVVNCPRCKIPCIEDELDHAQCSGCYFSFCTLCLERRHVGVECMTLEMKLILLKERQNSSHLDANQKKREREMINDILSMKQIKENSKQCPNCKMAIIKISGCNKMVCENCSQFFCYKCGKKITGYEHYRNDECELFPQEVLQEWQEGNNPRVDRGEIQAYRVAELVAANEEVNGQRCPRCGQFNAKFNNNNHISCWSCQLHFCYLCREIVRRSAEHYGGRKGCKQHTPRWLAQRNIRDFKRHMRLS